MEPAETCYPVSATAVGFALPELVIMESLPSKETIAALEESIRYKNLVHTELLSEQITRMAMKPQTPLNQKIAAQEVTRKLAGLEGRKHDPNLVAAGHGYQLVINIGSDTSRTFSGVTFEQPKDVTPIPD